MSTPLSGPTRETKAGLIPTDWEAVQVGSFGAVVTGTTPATSDPGNFGTDVPFVTPGDLGSSAYVSGAERGLSHSGASRARILPKGAVLAVCIGSLGKFGIASCPLCTNQQLNSVVCRNREDAEFLYYSLRFRAQHLKQFAGVTVVPILNKGDFSSYWVALPPPGERRKIAAILRSVDEAIERTEAVIAALREVKRGMMQELLTKGIDENGQMRDPVAHPEQFHETKLGLLPKAWDIVTLGGLGKWHSGGTPSKSNPDYWEGDLPWVSPKDMKQLLLDDVEDHISLEGATSGSRTMPAETVLVVVRGMILAHSFPVAVITRPMAFNQDIKALACGDRVLPRFVLYWLTSNASSMLNLVTDSTHGTKRIDTGGLLRREMPLPPYDEQVAIHQRLAAADGEMEALARSVRELAELKRGLMQQLLTGKVRVR